MWTSQAHRTALLELWSTGRLRRRKRWVEAWDWLDHQTWTRQLGRHDVLALTPAGAGELEALLERAWPAWREAVQALEAEGLSADERGVDELERRRQAAGAEDLALPERVNGRNLAAFLAARSLVEAPPGVAVTRDGIVRLRPSAGLRLVRHGGEHDAAELAGLLGEVVLSERALLDGTRLAGTLPRAVLLVENRGPFVDLPAPEDWLLAHVPGWDTSGLALLLQALPPEIPVLHFGDLDPKGVRLMRDLQELRPDLRWCVPAFWEAHLERAPRCDWPRRLVQDEDPALLRKLATRGLRLEQELVVLDHRLPAALEEGFASFHESQ